MIDNIIHPFSSGYPYQGCTDAGAYPRYHRVRGRVRLGQVASLSQG